MVWKIFEGFEVLWKMDGPKVSILGPTLTPPFPPKGHIRSGKKSSLHGSWFWICRYYFTLNWFYQFMFTEANLKTFLHLQWRPLRQYFDWSRWMYIQKTPASMWHSCKIHLWFIMRYGEQEFLCQSCWSLQTTFPLQPIYSSK